MDTDEFMMHLRAGVAYGQESTCGDKVDYKAELSASLAAVEMSVQYGRTLEAYPCWYCRGWHIGRKMTAEERVRFW
jgi:hypothetical protein